MNKKIVVILVVAMLLYFLYKKLTPVYYMKKAIKSALNHYDREIVENAEKMFRLESANFTSQQFLETFSAGMEPAVQSYPFGWSSLKAFWDSHPEYKPTGLQLFTENGTGLKKNYIKFHSVEAGFFTLCEWLRLHSNNPGRWFSTESNLQTVYNQKIDNIKPAYTNEV